MVEVSLYLNPKGYHILNDLYRWKGHEIAYDRC